MKKINLPIKIATFFIIVIASFLGCKKFVTIPPPNSQIVTQSVFSDANAATAALMAIYVAMYNNAESFTMSQSTGLMGDELLSPSSSDQVKPFLLNALLPASSYAGRSWVNGFNYIYQANAIIEGLHNNTDINSSIKNQLTGEAKFIRSFWNFYLVNCYGDIPLVLSTDYTTNVRLSRTSKAGVYQQMVDDLRDADSLLNTNYVDQSDTAFTADRIRPNKAAAEALLARVYLYAGDYQHAELYSKSIISNSVYQLVNDLNAVFLINSKEAIWQIATPTPNPNPPATNTMDGFNYILTTAPNVVYGTQTATIAPDLWNSFEPNDERKSKWINSFITSDSTDTFYFPFKYKNTSPSVTENTMMLRLAEQYLIHAEALVRQNKDLDQAVIDLNSIRQRAGLGAYSGPLQSDSLLPAILHERQVELFTEWGQRWLDMIRTGVIDQVMTTVNPNKGGQGWNSNWALFPIPQSEILKDFNLTQNPGY